MGKNKQELLELLESTDGNVDIGSFIKEKKPKEKFIPDMSTKVNQFLFEFYNKYTKWVGDIYRALWMSLVTSDRGEYSVEGYPTVTVQHITINKTYTYTISADTSIRDNGRTYLLISKEKGKLKWAINISNINERDRITTESALEHFLYSDVIQELSQALGNDDIEFEAYNLIDEYFEDIIKLVENLSIYGSSKIIGKLLRDKNQSGVLSMIIRNGEKFNVVRSIHSSNSEVIDIKAVNSGYVAAVEFQLQDILILLHKLHQRFKDVPETTQISGKTI